MKVLQGIAILFMLSLHLFARKEVNGIYETFPTINGIPLIYYIGLFGDACVPIYLFASGYGLFISISTERVSSTEEKFHTYPEIIVKCMDNINYLLPWY